MSDPSFPASPGQQRHWRFQRAHPGSAAFSMTVALHLTGVLEVACVRQALAWLLARHESLRVTFEENGGVLTQRVRPAPAVPFELADLSALPSAPRYARLTELGAAEAARPFDLTREPVTRITLVRLGAAEHVLIVNVHHIAFDGWSLALLLEELAAGYPAALAGRPDPAPPLAADYFDFAVRQQAALSSARQHGQLGYWREQLADPPPGVRWPAEPATGPDRAGGTAPDGTAPDGTAPPGEHGAVCWGLLPATLPPAVTTLARQLRATPYLVQLAAFLMLLRAWTGSGELCVGVPLAGRRQAADERVLGFYVNTVALRVSIAGDQRGADVVGMVRQRFLGAYRNQDVPFGVVLDDLAGAAGRPPAPLFQTMFILQNEMRAAPSWAQVTAGQTMIATGFAKYDLTVSLEGREQTLAIDAEYRPSCLPGQSAPRFLSCYAALLHHLTLDPGRPADRLAELALRAPADLTTAARPGESPIGALFRGPVSDWRAGRPAAVPVP